MIRWIVAAAIACTACKAPPPPAEEKVLVTPVLEPDPCGERREKIAALVGGPQPCETGDDCTVWHNGEFWNGCPSEVSKANARELDRLREDYEKAGCIANTNGRCLPMLVRGCVAGACGKTPPFLLKLTPAQQKAYDESRNKPLEPAE